MYRLVLSVQELITLVWFSSLSWHQPHVLGLPTSEGSSIQSFGRTASLAGLQWLQGQRAPVGIISLPGCSSENAAALVVWGFR